ncbi:MAG: hypothetical protein MUO19_01245, partial [Dehalococcoidales bacterium]|nr:hypothetical protein [Dehalococcoidales bacterium]
MTSDPSAMSDMITDLIQKFVLDDKRNRMPADENLLIFDEPLVQFADGDDPLFTELKTIIDTSHLTPREALVLACDGKADELPEKVSVISWILPITEKTRESN